MGKDGDAGLPAVVKDCIKLLRQQSASWIISARAEAECLDYAQASTPKAYSASHPQHQLFGQYEKPTTAVIQSIFLHMTSLVQTHHSI